MDNNIFINKSISDLSFDNIVNNNSDIKLIDNIIDPNRIFLEDTDYSEIYGLLKYQEDILLKKYSTHQSQINMCKLWFLFSQ